MGYKQQNHTTWHKDDEIFNSKKMNRTLKQTEMEAEWVHISKGLIITLQQNCPFTSCLPWPKARVGKGEKVILRLEKNGNCHRKCSAANSCPHWAGVWHGQTRTVVRNRAELAWLWNGDTKTWDKLPSAPGGCLAASVSLTPAQAGSFCHSILHLPGKFLCPYS